MYQFIFQPEFPGFPGKCPGGFVLYPDGHADSRIIRESWHVCYHKPLTVKGCLQTEDRRPKTEDRRPKTEHQRPKSAKTLFSTPKT